MAFPQLPPPPSPGQVVAAAGAVMQAAENFISQPLQSAVNGLAQQADNIASGRGSVAVQAPGGQQAQLVSRQQFEDFSRAVKQVTDHLASEIASVRAYGGGSSSSGFGFGGGMDVNNLLMLKLLGVIDFGTTTEGSSSIDTTTLLLIMMMGGGGGGFGGAQGQNQTLMLMLLLGAI